MKQCVVRDVSTENAPNQRYALVTLGSVVLNVKRWAVHEVHGVLTAATRVHVRMVVGVTLLQETVPVLLVSSVTRAPTRVRRARGVNCVTMTVTATQERCVIM